MIPVALDPRYLRLAVAGAGGPALRRWRALRAAGAAPLLFAVAPEPEWAAQAGEMLRVGLPDDADVAGLHVLWITGLPAPEAEALAGQARRHRVLVNVEDQPAQCDFHSVAEVRRGDLLLTVSTNGAAPGLAGTIRRNLESCFPPEWETRVQQIAAMRAAWRAEGAAMPEIARRIDVLAKERCWLSCPPPN